MAVSVSHLPPGPRAENPWRTVLEFQLGSDLELKEGGRRKDRPLVVGLGAGVSFGLTTGVLFLSFLRWLLG